MKIETIAVTNLPTNSGVVRLKTSLVKYGIPNKVIITPWQGFFTKVDQAYKYCKETDADYLLFIDAHDTVFVGGLDVIVSQIELHDFPDAIFSTEKAIWPPVEELINSYPEFNIESPWKYLNSGGYLIKPEFLIKLYEERPPLIGWDDQWYWAEHFINNQDRFILDHDCVIFQTLAHDNGSSFGLVDGVFKNKVTKTNPIVIHGNGRVFDQIDYSYIFL